MGPTPYPSEERAPVREQPSRTEPPDSGPEFRSDGGAGRGARPGTPPGSRTVVTPRLRHEREKWPRQAVRFRLGYGYGNDDGRGPSSRRAAPPGGPTGGPAADRHVRPHDNRERTPATAAPRTGAAIETTEDRA